ncbi:hypothetical protein QYE76_046805 [Lolium multiflorum]|uniref:Uncharacterized protein n=1 Tax=Lolium multiflorum TaxID=4521 RepID=A0AAD8TQI7_LOLMU|nr:hypothetical protein QYE76_046805 [Lolium multiflorum]
MVVGGMTVAEAEMVAAEVMAVVGAGEVTEEEEEEAAKDQARKAAGQQPNRVLAMAASHKKYTNRVP